MPASKNCLNEIHLPSIVLEWLSILKLFELPKLFNNSVEVKFWKGETGTPSYYLPTHLFSFDVKRSLNFSAQYQASVTIMAFEGCSFQRGWKAAFEKEREENKQFCINKFSLWSWDNLFRREASFGRYLFTQG